MTLDTIKAVSSIVEDSKKLELFITCGSLMHQNKVSAKEIQKIFGHENIQTTLNLYVHTNPETLRDAVDILGKAIAG